MQEFRLFSHEWENIWKISMDDSIIVACLENAVQNWFAILKLRETGAGEEVNNVVVPGPKLIDSTRRGETEINYPLSGSVCSDETLAV